MAEDNNSTDVTPLSVSAYFDETHKKYLNLLRGSENTGSADVQTKVTELIKKLEDLTRQVSVLGILSDNENYKEMNPSELKFILLPFMMGQLWQLSMSDTRENVGHLSIVYFRDYLKRCFNYEIILKLPPEAKPDEEEENDTEKETKKVKSPPRVNSDDVRVMKIQRFKDIKMLDDKIALYLEPHLNGGSLDDEEWREFIVSLLKRNALEAENELKSIAQEFELIRFAENMGIGNKQGTSAGGSSSASSSTACPHTHQHMKKDIKRKLPKTFIITKTQAEKQVFGTGYPAVPILTVDEMYEQRRKTGQWGPPPTSMLPPVGETDDDRDTQKESLEDQDDDALLESRRRMDDYKDDHRAGWGNRYNRS
ncbi:Immunoglobulin-binding protein 1 [Orchesella cincta]|uniref:Immunoglobulin-binding protein 1 n=1 Tax=Orchesella cincta TaxID=48709 RepID=A0A1D2N8Y8_ORCCI|nr:Immunoglobulin-binding protein 1 [Orchesella cincta]